MIPRVIHYIWVGPQKPEKLIERCINSWKKYLPDYEIKFWTEENSPIEHPYVQEMYKKGKWAFVSDYIRFWVLYNEGGVYLDTDMEVLKPLDTFLNNKVFLAKTKDGVTACGIIGAELGNDFIKKVLERYDNDSEYSTEHTSPKIVTAILANNQFNDVPVYGSDLFYPFDDGEYNDPKLLIKAYTNHHWAESWVSHAWLRKILRRIGLMKIIKKIFGK